ncbi:MAG: hypothetical protein AAFX92_16220 [Pseudomonadota bacterium]
MLERRSPLAHLIEARAAGVPDQHARLILSEQALGALWQVAGWQDFETVVEPVLAALGFAGLGDHCSVRVSAGTECYRIAPDRILLRCPDAGALSAALDKAPPGRLTALDLSHARIVIRISGTAAVDLMARLVPLDFAGPAFSIDSFAQTGIHGVPVLTRRLSEEAFDLFVPVTWAVSVLEIVCKNARPFGYAVEASRPTSPGSRLRP